MAQGSPNILVEDIPSAVVLTLSRPDQLNALSRELMTDLREELLRQGARPLGEVRAIVLAAAGRAFSAGHDLKEMAGVSEEQARDLFTLCSDLMMTIRQVPQPVIAEVRGVATAAGCQLVAACDLAVASEEARFATSGVRYGLFCFTPGVAVSRNLGRKRALEMLLTGRFISARTAEAWGLVNRVAPGDGLRQEVLALVEELAQHSPRVLAAGKRGFYEQLERSEAAAYQDMTVAIARNAAGPEGQEGIRAFIEKRRPVW